MSSDRPGSSNSSDQRQFELIDAARRQTARVRSSEAALDPPIARYLQDRMGDARIPSEAIAGYEIEGEIHRGGQGVVYQATHGETGRKVAIKVMRVGPFGGPKERARFEREVRILEVLDHPNIVTIHDIGSAGGFFYYVMDFIDGQPLDAYLAGIRARSTEAESVRAILRLFVRICKALHAAHVLGIVHRDLKPRNILIDQSGDPRILDFGLAKMASDSASDETEPSVMTVTGQFVGSLPWASPEQAEGRLGELDTRTDVYALGVILYQLLTEEFPYPVLGNAREVVDHIVQTQPQRPSAKRPHLNDEIDTIVLMCLRKERGRRYMTAGALAHDLELLLAGEPIEAKRDSHWYMLKKTILRYRVPVAVASSFTVLITVSAVALWAMYLKSEASAALAMRERTDAVAAREAESTARVQAELEAQKAKEIQAFLRDMLAAADPYEAKGKEVTVREVLDAAVEQIEEESITEPEVEASLRSTLALTYERLGEFEVAEPQARRALDIYIREFGEDDPRALTSMNRYGNLLYQLAHLAEAETWLRRGLDGRRRVLGEDHCDTATSINDLAIVLRTQGRLEEAEPLARRALEARRQDLGEDNDCTMTTANTIATLLQEQGKLEEAESLFRQVLEFRRRTLDGHHPDLLGSMNNLANLLRARDKLAEAGTLLLETIELSHEVFGEKHMNTLIATNNLGLVYQGQGQLDEAAAWFKQAYDGALETLSGEHMVTLFFEANYGRCLALMSRFEEAEQHLLDAYHGIERTLGPEHARARSSLKRIIQLYEAWGRPEEAAKWQAILDG